MASTKEEPTFGASIVRAPPSDLRAPPSIDSSPVLTPAVSRDSELVPAFNDKPIPPHSPFYQHPPASHERVQPAPLATAHSRQSSKNHIGVAEKDLESGCVTPLSTRDDTNPFTSKISVDANKECAMWPSKQTILRDHQAVKKQRRAKRTCGCVGLRERWTAMTKRQKLLVQIAVALFLVGVVVAIGVGVSKAVDGGVYSGNGSSKQVGSGT